MSFSLIVRKLAETDLLEAQRWYEDQRPGLGAEYRAAIDEQLQRIAQAPRMYPKVHRTVRRAVVRRFPYLIYFLLEADSVVVLACLHTSQDPERIRERIG